MDELHVGARVIVPWGLDYFDGEVVEVIDSGLGKRVVVRVNFPGTPEGSEEILVTLPESVVDSIDDNRTPPVSGSWAVAAHYEQELTNAVLRVLSDTDYRSNVMPHGGPDVGADIIVEGPGDNRVLIEAKQGRSSKVTVDQFVRRGDPHTKRLLVSNVDASEAAKRVMHAHNASRNRLVFVRWRGTEDDADLANALRGLLALPPY